MVYTVERSMRGMLEFIPKVEARIGPKDKVVEKESRLVDCSNMPNEIKLDNCQNE